MGISAFGQNLSRKARKSSPKSHDVRPRDFVTVSNSIKNSFPPMAIIPVDTPWPRLGGKLYVAGGYGPQELSSTENASVEIQMISDLVRGKS